MDHRNPVCTCTCAITAESSWKQTIAVSEWKLNISLTTWKTRLSSMVKYASAGIMHYWKVLPVTLTPEPWPWKYHQCHMDVVMSNCDVSLKYVSAFQRQAKKCIRNCLYVVSLWRSFTVDLLVSKSHHFIYISNCTLTVNLLKFPQAVCMISCVYDIMYMIRHTHTHTDKTECLPQLIASRGIKRHMLTNIHPRLIRLQRVQHVQDQTNSINKCSMLHQHC